MSMVKISNRMDSFRRKLRTNGKGDNELVKRVREHHFTVRRVCHEQAEHSICVAKARELVAQVFSI